MNSQRIFSWLERRSSHVLAAVLVLTGLLLVPYFLLTPDTEATTDPPGDVFDALNLLDERLASPLFTPLFLVEARDGDMLLRDPLLELLRNEQVLRDSPAVAEELYTHQSADLGATVTGVYTIADAVDKHLRDGGVAGGLEDATDEQVKVAAHELLVDGAPTSDLGEGFSQLSTEEMRTVNGQTIVWQVVPAISFAVLADNEALGGGGFIASFGADEVVLDKEEYSRDVQVALRSTEDTFRTWGIAVDANLTSAEEGAKAGPFIAFTIIAVLLVVGLVLRSYWAVALIGTTLAILMIWLKGTSNLVGLDGSIIMSFIVPIAMISFGVDFAFHAIGRYREESANQHSRPDKAYVAGLTAVSAALILALLSDSLAFLSNVASGIPAIVQFGIGASIALTYAYVILGVVTPLALMRIEDRVATGKPAAKSAGRRVLSWLAIAAAALFAGFTVLFLVFFPIIGAPMLLVYVLAFLVAPLYVASRGDAPEAQGSIAARGGSWAAAGRFSALFARARMAVIPAAAMLTAASMWFALQIEASFDVKDFFSSNSDFVIGLDKIDEHLSSGEPALLYVDGDLRQPDALLALRDLKESIDESSTGRFGRLASGEIQVDAGVLEIVEEAMGSPIAVATIEGAMDVNLSDSDGDGLPDTPEAVEAIYRYSLVGGIPGEDGLILTPDNIPSIVWFHEDGTLQTTMVVIGFTGTREQENIAAARDELAPLIDRLDAELTRINPSSSTQITGSPVSREEGMRATVRALQISLPVAIILCFVVAVLFMRSLRFALVAIAPILIVVAWLYALMYFLGFSLNIVTATIGAISIGVGIDYAIHFTMRYREEFARTGRRIEAVETTGSGTGSALIASAASSIIGFAIMGFAPMPMFATYGLLTALMIFLAAAASLVVLPALLVAVTRDRSPARASP